MEYPIGKRITEIREKKGISVTQLAKMAGISKSTLWEIENGKISPNISTLWSIANALGVTFGELITYDIVVKDEGSEVRLIERNNNIEVYLMKLNGGSVRYSKAHSNSPVELVHVIKGAMIVGPFESPEFVWEGKTVKFYGGVDHVYAAVGGEAEAIVTMKYFSEKSITKIEYRNIKEIKIEKYRDLLESKAVNNNVLATAISTINDHDASHLQNDDLLLFDVLSAELKTLSGTLTVPKVVFNSLNSLGLAERSSVTNFEKNIDVVRYYIYEPLHPGYAEQAVFVAYELERRNIKDVISIGCGPAYHEAMLKEIIPDLSITCIENSQFFKKLSPFKVLDEVPNGVNAIISFGSSHHIEGFLRLVANKLKKGGTLIVSDEFVADYSSERERKRNVIRHHLGYLLDIPLAEFREELLSAFNAKNIDISLGILSRIYIKIFKNIKDKITIDRVEDAFLNFYYLELTSLLLGVAYIEEKKVSLNKFIAESSMLGLKLDSVYKVYPTGKDSGTYVVAFTRA
ncbi:helix-turn-helix domain-containing protein [Sulfurisphaera tokodaii]|uniref:Xre family DNA-binding protein n=2 Tax=Sulfurisphaera tokodaii TaxID=111955 RepID=Q96YU3_SULTO|nr:helix-turn-helix domain-containing protein [Sulfurisphaera tokodaii]BAB67183.1 putative Xre family DNA-binding protein [Sulfurisphaera tokodaii str. 7]HII72915.1 helix-turn-helix domain-containing protein [Sulfurisphaera tokodaii]